VTLLGVTGLGKRFAGLQAIDGVSFAVEPGEIYAIIGPNGAGKTTLLNVVTGIYAPSAGRIELDGRDVTGRRPPELAARGLSRTFQNLQIFGTMSAVENVMVGAHLHAETSFLAALFRWRGFARKERRLRAEAAQLLERVGIGELAQTSAAAMPYGALKRLEIARALASRPRLLLLDEPAAGLNPSEARDLAVLIRDIAADGVTIVLVEHNMPLVMAVASRILVLHHGQKIAEGAPAAIRADREVIAAYLGVGRHTGARELQDA
jgi:branched-chain amino acid transport system ATP-binding protein